MSKSETIADIAELLELQENAINHHPSQTVAVYVKYRDAFIEGQYRNKDKDFTPLSFDDVALMHRYMQSSSFISAWYEGIRDRSKRDKAAQSCCTLVAAMGGDPRDVMAKYLEYEQSWQQVMNYEGIVPRRYGLILLGFGLLVVLIAAIAILMAL